MQGSRESETSGRNKTFLPGALSNAVSAMKCTSYAFINAKAGYKFGNKFVSTKYFVSRYHLALFMLWAS